MHSFSGVDGSNPYASVILGKDGKFYGTTTQGGTDGVGTVFRMTPAGTLTTLNSFSASSGYTPATALVTAGEGNFSGTTYQGGTYGNGAIYRLTANGSYIGEAPLYYSAGSEGNLIRAADGELYGASSGGGEGDGTFFEVLFSPTITSAAAAAGNVGEAFNYQITATGGATSFAATGLPAGLSVNARTGLISGKPTDTGVSKVTIRATNSVGTGTAMLTLTVSAAAPTITSATTASATEGTSFSYQITATNKPTHFGVQGLPGGLTVNATTGVVSGTPKTAGVFKLALIASKSVGKGSATLTLTIQAPIRSRRPTARQDTACWACQVA